MRELYLYLEVIGCMITHDVSIVSQILKCSGLKYVYSIFAVRPGATAVHPVPTSNQLPNQLATRYTQHSQWHCVASTASHFPPPFQHNALVPFVDHRYPRRPVILVERDHILSTAYLPLSSPSSSVFALCVGLHPTCSSLCLVSFCTTPNFHSVSFPLFH